jgi:predicted pyridoxine 5'-phosphate oxidase superfamily flavin-nucleotide-binding protein
MAAHYQELMFTPPVRAAQQRYYGRPAAPVSPSQPDALTTDEIEFIQARDSFYLGTVSPTGWPYIQHRGGEPGFLHVLDQRRLAFADYKGNRQMISTGHLAHDSRVSLFLMDYPQRQRLKLLGRARIVDPREQPELLESIADPQARRITERLFVIDVVSFDWNCPQYITPRYTAREVEDAVGGLRDRIRQLEAELAASRKPAASP